MRKQSSIAAAAFAVFSLAALTGCDSEKAEVQWHEPGKYLGAVDPLLKNGPDEEALKKRFASIQTDR